MSNSNEVSELVLNPYGGGGGQPAGGSLAETIGGRGVAARENTEVMAMAMMAKRFPRNPIVCCDRIKNAFTRASLAEQAQYQFSRGGTDIVGPSIRAAEAISQQWGNMNNGWRELARSTDADGVGVSMVEAFSVDNESGNREEIRFVVRHWRDTKSGGYKLKDERDIYELCANQAQRRKRACILATIPGDVVNMAMDQASVTLKTSADVSPEAMKRLVEAFKEFGVTQGQIEKRIQRRMDAIQPAQVVALRRVFASLRDEMSTAVDWFEPEETAATGTPPPPNGSSLADIKGAAAGKGKGKAKDEGKAPPTTIEGAEVAPPAGAPAAASTDDAGGEPVVKDGETVTGASTVVAESKGPTFEQVMKDLKDAKNMDDLNDAASLFKTITNRAHSVELNKLYSERMNELGG